MYICCALVETIKDSASQNARSNNENQVYLIYFLIYYFGPFSVAGLRMWTTDITDAHLWPRSSSVDNIKLLNAKPLLPQREV